jgi:glutamate decarboxylase
LTAGLALKFRWRKWYASKQHPDLTEEQITGIKPNIVISTCYQAAWEKFFRYFDMEPNFVKPCLLNSSKGAMDAKAMEEKS